MCRQISLKLKNFRRYFKVLQILAVPINRSEVVDVTETGGFSGCGHEKRDTNMDMDTDKDTVRDNV
jgi:hypothetical protein